MLHEQAAHELDLIEVLECVTNTQSYMLKVIYLLFCLNFQNVINN